MNVGITALLNEFVPITLGEMDGVKLMNRTDTKYVFPFSKLPELLQLACCHYKMLEINNRRDLRYSTTYMDTSDYLFFYQQATGKLKRHKIRYRTYESTGTTFLEVKCKTNKRRTIKWRIENRLMHYGCDCHALEFLKDFVPEEFAKLKPVLVNRFTRLTLVGLETTERITIDYALSFSDGNGRCLHLPYLAIAELKREGYTNQSPFVRLIKACKIRPTGFSKYCIGSSLLYNLPRKNIFKPKFLLLNKIEYEHYDISAKQS